MSLISLLAVLLALGILVFFWIRKNAMTYALIIANFLVFALMIVTAGRFETASGSILADELAFRPIYLSSAGWTHAYTVVTSAFLHADFLHIFGNMIVLLLGGLPFEERIGRGRYLGLYLFTAILGSLFHAASAFWGGDPRQIGGLALGASGAVFGVLGGFAAAYPRDKIPVFPIPLLVITFLARNVPVVIAAVMLAALDAFALFLSGGYDGVAHVAHLGGAVGGVVAALLLRPPGKAPSAMGAGRKIDFTSLHRLAQDERTRALIERVRENSDAAELQKAWLDRLLVALRCPACGQGLAEVRPGVLECDDGHREKYVL